MDIQRSLILLRKFVPGVVAFLFAFSSVGQQVGQYSMYLQNPYILNPAAAGLEDQLDVSLSFRKQWVGFENSPQTYYVSANTAIVKSPHSPRSSSVRISQPGRYDKLESGRIRHGLGGFIVADEFGAFKKNAANLTYALHLPFTKKLTVSFGTNVGLSNWQFDQDKVTLEEPDDELYAMFANQSSNTANVLDINFGTWIYTKKFFVGYAPTQLLQNKFSFDGTQTDAKLNVFHQVMGGYNYRLSPDWVIVPNFLLKYSRASPVSVDVNLRVDYQDRFWFGSTYRHDDAVIAMAGLHFNDMIRFGYSFDFTTSSLGSYNSGSHEIFLGIRPFSNNSKNIVF